MAEAYLNEQYVLENFHEALENHWIKVFYQGIVRTETGNVTAFEALARWLDPVRGMLTPSEFIPVLEKHHMIHELNRYMAEEVLREVGERKAAGLPIVPVSVNFSAEDFDTDDMPEQLMELVQKYDAEPWMLTVEITERTYAKCPERMGQQIDKLKECGFQLWLDDFGSGYSSLNRLGTYHFDLIKLDILFLRELDLNDGFNRVIMKGICDVAKVHGLATLAEGVEDESQHQFLKEIGCDYEQGFYFGKPIPLQTILFNLKHNPATFDVETPQGTVKLT